MKKIKNIVLFILILFLVSCQKSYKYVEKVSEEDVLGGKQIKEKDEIIIKALNDSSAYLDAYQRFCISVKVSKDMAQSLGVEYSTPISFKLINDQGEDITNTIMFASRTIREKEIEENLSKNIPFTVRFKAFEKNFSFKDLVRGEVTFPKGMIGDFVIQRSNGMPVYNFCCAIDDYLMKIDVVIRGEEHLPNTLRQLMIYEVLGSCPQFAHVSLLIGEDRQKLSKRHGHTSLKEFKEKGILPQTMINYLSLLGWSHPEEKDIYNLEELVSVFSLDRFSKASAIFDIKKFFYINSEHIKLMSWSEINKQIETYFATCDYTLEASWKEKFIELFKNYSDKLDSFKEHFKELFLSKVELDVDAKAVMAYDTQSALLKVVENYTWRDTVWISLEEIEELMKELKSQKIKGKNLFMGLRVAFTGKTHGPDLKVILQLTPLPILKERLKQVKTYV